MASPRPARRPAHRTHAPRRWVLAPLRILVALVIAFATLPFIAAGTAQAAVPTSIAIDGNQDGADQRLGRAVWPGTGFTPIQDPVGNADTSTFSNSESDYPNFQAGSVGHAVRQVGHRKRLRLQLPQRQRRPDRGPRLDRAGDTGTGRYYVELEPEARPGPRPRPYGRRPSGHHRHQRLGHPGVPAHRAVERHRLGRSDGLLLDPGRREHRRHGGLLRLPQRQRGRHAGAEHFVELGINLTAFGATACPVAGYRSLTIRSPGGRPER